MVLCATPCRRPPPRPQPNYKGERVTVDSDDEDYEDDEDEDDEDENVSEDESDDEEVVALPHPTRCPRRILWRDEVGAGCGANLTACVAGCAQGERRARKPSKAKAKAKPKGSMAKPKPKAEGGKRKQIKSRGVCVPRGGRGFVCPAEGCDYVADSAEEVLAHAAAECGVEGRARTEDGKSRCLWDGCGTMVKVIRMEKGKWRPWGHLFNLKTHESYHEKGEVSRGFVCPSDGCEQAFATSEEAWAHAEEAHEIEHNGKVCLWEGCGFVAGKPINYRKHEPVHTGKWPFVCSTCGNGFPQPGEMPARAARPTHPLSPRPYPDHSPLLFHWCGVAYASDTLPAASPTAERAEMCCRVTAACKCGWEMKGHNGPGTPLPLSPRALPRSL